jgi:hypothetical protein
VEGEPISIAIGDFNGDGRQDFATANRASNNVSIRVGDGAGGFTGTTTLQVKESPRSVAVGDFNGDGRHDLAIANFDSHLTSVLLGDNAGGFTGGLDVNVGGTGCAIAIGDFNGDGKQDLVVANEYYSFVAVRFGDGAGGFPNSTNLGTGETPESVAVGDFNGDGKQDIVTANISSGDVSILLGNGGGGFSGTSVFLDKRAISVAVGDFNGDGRQDFAVASWDYSSYISILMGGGNKINLKGNDVSIPDGANSPVTANLTDMGTACGSPISKTFTIENTGTLPLQLNSDALTLTGTDAAMFTVGGIVLPISIAAGKSTTFTVTFSPSASTGTKTAIVHIANDDCDEADYDFAVTATDNALPTLAVNGDAATTLISGSTTLTATAASCRIVADILPVSPSPLSGSITAQVWVDATVQEHNGSPYLQRHYDIEPTTNAATATAAITLYFTQAEFDVFNEEDGIGLLNGLPVNPTDARGIGNLRIYQFHGSSTGNTGLPASYTGSETKIDPDNDKIIWNEILQRWEVTFNVEGFSGFFVKTESTALPLRLISFSGTQETTTNKLQWQTADEVNTKSFELESSKDGRNFKKLASIDAVSSGNNSYGYTDVTAYKGIMYYRLKMIDIDRTFTYSRILGLSRDGKSTINLFPNPVTDRLTISVDINLISSEAKFYNVSGRLLQTIKITSGEQPVSVKTLPTGVYIIRFKDGSSRSFLKE